MLDIFERGIDYTFMGKSSSYMVDYMKKAEDLRQVAKTIEQICIDWYFYALWHKGVFQRRITDFFLDTKSSICTPAQDRYLLWGRIFIFMDWLALKQLYNISKK